MTRTTRDLRVRKIRPLTPPGKFIRRLPMTGPVRKLVIQSRKTLVDILRKKDPRLLVIVGPCSIHDKAAALEYAKRLARLREQYLNRLYIVMRVYFEKPRTTVGWKGLIADPRLDGSHDIPYGLALARRILLDITGLGLPAGTEMLDPIVPQYTADLITWAAVGARTTESQTHREMASGLSMPVGFKNSTGGNLQVAIDAMESARHPHSFLGIDTAGKTAVVSTAGNPYGHLILRGGRRGPNYMPAGVREAEKKLKAAGLDPVFLVDCSHANAGKRHERQEIVLKSVLAQRRKGRRSLIGVMIESNLREGSQPLRKRLSALRYGVSVTDECVGWEKTESMLAAAYRAL